VLRWVKVGESEKARWRSKRKKWRSCRLEGYHTPAEVSIKGATIGQGKKG